MINFKCLQQNCDNHFLIFFYNNLKLWIILKIQILAITKKEFELLTNK